MISLVDNRFSGPSPVVVVVGRGRGRFHQVLRRPWSLPVVVGRGRGRRVLCRRRHDAAYQACDRGMPRWYARPCARVQGDVQIRPRSGLHSDRGFLSRGLKCRQVEWRNDLEDVQYAFAS